MSSEQDYLKAKEDMAKALLSFSRLNDSKKMELLNELALATTGATLYEMLTLLKNS